MEVVGPKNISNLGKWKNKPRSMIVKSTAGTVNCNPC